MINRLLGISAAILLSTAAAGAQQLPERITGAGLINVGIERDHPPMEFVDPKTGELVGFDVDLINAIAQELGVKLAYVHSRFEGLTPNLQSKRIDLIISGMYDTPARRENFDFVDYLSAGAVFFTLDRNSDIQKPIDLCGKVVTANRGTSYPASVEKWSSENCVSAGLPPIEVITDTDMASEFLYLNQGRAQGSLQGTEAIPTVLASKEGPFRTLGGPFTDVKVGIGFRKDDPELRDAVLAALEKVFTSGKYSELIAKWGIQASALDKPTVNQGAAP
ncbi:ABC transporter substrate-binding protein [Mesorhizobium sp. BAC0120]|uniref:ABC transporter substrate-binding protein n=1 Tax=Mesorhizobium sp. BAC0120 TaxID=3090670 RepID=UPI00298CCD48|nr:ABC transporter substrate-binding protein [Mesorhizobium sp. BAC0120]MDW6023020.1 ABC transporter substrate-binding protein [Mesorhizobium sp. BAC0120]